MASPGRNSPCPCGSGRKYKQCCLAKDESRHIMEEAPRAARLVFEALALGRQLEGTDLAASLVGALQSGGRELSDLDAAFVYPVAAWHSTLESGQPLGEAFLEHGRLSDSDRAFVRAQLDSWLSIWEVEAVVPGQSLDLVDQLTGARRTVVERTGSQEIRPRTMLLARVVDEPEGVSTLDGLDCRPLSPDAGAQVVKVVRRHFRKRSRPVEVEKLRGPAPVIALTTYWDQAIEFQESRPPPQLANTDGDPFLLTRDTYTFARGDRRRLREALAEAGGEVVNETATEVTFDFIREGNQMHASWESTLVGRAELRTDRLVLETNSVNRADALREQVEAACPGLLRRRVRTHEDPVSSQASRHSEPPEVTPEIAEIIRETKRQHYQAWLDMSLPALGGRTPREAAGIKSQRRAVEEILKSMEFTEASLPEGERFDVGALRRELGL